MLMHAQGNDLAHLRPADPAAESPPFRAPHAQVENFLPNDLARDMRAAVDAHFAEPYKQTAEHQVWNYWYVPDMYTFLRTSPDKVIPQPLLERFQIGDGST